MLKTAALFTLQYLPMLKAFLRSIPTHVKSYWKRTEATRSVLKVVEAWESN